MSNYINKNLYSNFLTVIIIFSLDRISKYYVILLNEKNLSPDIFTSKYLNISLIWNQGIAFGLFSFNEVNLYNFLTALIAIIIAIIFFMILRSEGIKKYLLLMILGGALGNLYDRIFYKAVPDFIDFHIGNFHWFIFNVADIFITLGIIFMIMLEIKDTNKVKKL